MQNTSRFSAANRIKILEEMADSELDLLVIGGGITGSGITLDAISRGLKVGLVEKGDFASGTSSKSGKLIHGGLKYLKQGDLGLVREVGHERAIVHENARHLVIPIKMLFPIVKNGSFNKISLKMGLATYDRLAGVRPDERHTMLNKNEVFEQEPLLNRDTVSGGGMYIEYRTDDSRLTLEVAKTAFELGAFVCNYTEMVELIKNEYGKVIGAIVRDHVSQRTFTIFAKFIVNAGGPWVDAIRRIDGSISGKRLCLSKGIHLVVPFEKLPVNESLYFDVDGRMIAVVPRDGCTYIGSTESEYTGDLDDVRVEQREVNYLLNCVNGMFPSVQLQQQDITSSWAGLRPLIYEEGKAPSELSRKDELFVSDSGLITIAGGKLTGYRKMAERVVDHVMQAGNLIGVTTKTDQLKLSGGQFNSKKELGDLINDLFDEYHVLGVTRNEITEFVYRYGSNTPVLFEYIKASMSSVDLKNIDKKEVFAAAESMYSIENEMAVRLSDFFIRRTGYLLFKRNIIPFIFDNVLSQMKNTLGWDDTKAQNEKILFNEDYSKSLSFL